ncbi:restriction endonuclease [Pseudomonas chlororaphis]|uniref:restriction endonuclease n=1 Tax=Pseudomonas chlororaphis TaxID=587753 RepID=UPI000B10DBD4|nr:restriction endonuclease [Pseudomonas chlororaphis]AZD28866.1 hypothetical protein C4K23_2117 [Pseudomonas chlororaphis]
MEKARVAIFDDFIPIKFDYRKPFPEIDNPSDWARSLGALKFTGFFDLPSRDGRYCQAEDERLESELRRLTKFCTCPICRNSTEKVPSWVEDENIQICLRCGYWGGIGFREWNSHMHSHPMRGVIGRYKAINPIDAQSTEYLVSHFRRFPEQLPNISPRRSETFVMDLLSDYLGCEVRSLGGTKDGGVDGYILKGEDISTIIQVKWHESLNKAESVRVVREVAGTLLARHVPKGILVSNRIKYSSPAKEEAESISRLCLEGLGDIELTLMDYNNILDMLEISNTKLVENMKVEDWYKIPEDCCVFDGAALVSESFALKYME